mmetsp:Transcript_18761/g.28109  ORF Transcript_18761/g.28109 Transcript_18761/m.28109 type:complete len:213 (-) Transcript_18761:168-806(-)
MEEIRKILSSISNTQIDHNRNVEIAAAEKKIRNVKGDCNSFKNEIRTITDSRERARYTKDLENYKQSLSKLIVDYQLLQGKVPKGWNFSETPLDNINNGHRTLSNAKNMQDTTQDALDNIKQMNLEAKCAVLSALEILEAQGDQINNVGESTKNLESNLVRADKLIKLFGRRMTTDKLIRCFACVNAILIVGVIIYAILRRTKNANKEPDVE